MRSLSKFLYVHCVVFSLFLSACSIITFFSVGDDASVSSAPPHAPPRQDSPVPHHHHQAHRDSFATGAGAGASLSRYFLYSVLVAVEFCSFCGIRSRTAQLVPSYKVYLLLCLLTLFFSFICFQVDQSMWS